jgi:adenylate cyclase class IV
MYEHELKFRVDDLAAVEKKILARGGVAHGTRNEDNYFIRFGGWLLRLRTDPPTLTVKGPQQKNSPVRSALEFNVPVPRFLLGLAVALFPKRHHYAKIRKVFTLAKTEVVLDTLVFGTFVEIEGAIKDVLAVQKLLGLKTPTRETYSRLAESATRASSAS